MLGGINNKVLMNFVMPNLLINTRQYCKQKVSKVSVDYPVGCTTQIALVAIDKLNDSISVIS